MFNLVKKDTVRFGIYYDYDKETRMQSNKVNAISNQYVMNGLRWNKQ